VLKIKVTKYHKDAVKTAKVELIDTVDQRVVKRILCKSRSVDEIVSGWQETWQMSSPIEEIIVS